MICRVVHQLAPLDENRISGILGAGPGRAAQCLLVVIKEVTSSKACALRTSGYFSLETGFVALGHPTQYEPGNTSPESHILIDHEAVDLTGGQDPDPWVDTHPFNGGKIMSKPLIVGVDVHRKTNTFCLMDASGQEVRSRFHPGQQPPRNTSLCATSRRADGSRWI